MAELTCIEAQDAAPEYALDILEPSRRAELVAHLGHCSSCRAGVDGMRRSACELLDLDAYDHAPPSLRPGRRRLRLVVTLAAAAAMLIGSALGPTLGTAPSHRPVLASAELQQAGQPVGLVVLYAGSSPSVELSVRGLSASGWLSLELLGVDGTVTRLGSFRVYAGRASWATSAHVDAARVSAVALVDRGGHVVAEAPVS